LAEDGDAGFGEDVAGKFLVLDVEQEDGFVAGTDHEKANEKAGDQRPDNS